MLNNISLAGSTLKYMSDYLIQSLTVNQMNNIKKIALLASVAFGIAASVYVLYKVTSYYFSKSSSNTGENSNAEDLHIDLEEIKRNKFPSKLTSDVIPRKVSPKSVKTTSIQDSSIHDKGVIVDSIPQKESPKSIKIDPIIDSSILEAEDILQLTPPFSPPKSPKIEPSSQPCLDQTVDPGFIASTQPKSKKMIELEIEFSFLCEEANKLKPSRSVLHLIVQKFNDKTDKAIEMIDFALSQGIAIDIGSVENKTPLYYAKNVEILNHLIDCGANPNAQDIKGRTPLHYVDKMEIAAALIGKGAKIDLIDNEGKSILEAQFDGFIDYPCNIHRQAIVDSLIIKKATLNCTDSTGELLKRAFQEAIKPEKARFPEGSYNMARKNCLDYARKMIALGAVLKPSAENGKLLETSLKEAILSNDVKQVHKALLFQIADSLIQFVPNLATCDPQGRLLVMAFEQIIHNNSTLYDPSGIQYYLNVIDTLAKMGSVRLDVADPKGALLNRIITDAAGQHPENKPSFLQPYFKVADKLIEMGATFAITDPDGILLVEPIRGFVKGSAKVGEFYLALIKELRSRGVALSSDGILLLNNWLSSMSWGRNTAKRMIEAELPDEIMVSHKTLAEWKKEF